MDLDFDLSRIRHPVEDLWWVAGSFVFFFIVDALLKLAGWFSKDHNGRYLTLHVLCNGFVTLVHFDDIIRCYLDFKEGFDSVDVDCRGTCVVLSLHLYHMVFFQPLPLIDWIHHLVMIIVMLPLAYLMQPGPMLGHGAFFASGLPGGLDYLMLVMVKKKWMDSLTEKRYNAKIMVWLRCPGCLYHTYFCWLGIVELDRRHASGMSPLLPYSPLPQHSPFAAQFCLFVCGITFFWNGLYFMERVVANHAVREEQLKIAVNGGRKQA
eukprot:NODE_4500_length_1055_cov_101.952790_g4298_i0.p1 GENE.NODE_4500_length_1055_cov_101.952790_g4298_i0~~NODE_4500_length_1055_cov_101.952790_g4298_i0.p1  ORF type:complete len:284 (-),score=40.18 NODE_4500_length_1055_cov_101.952790_g4298_i0:202-996(-)